MTDNIKRAVAIENRGVNSSLPNLSKTKYHFRRGEQGICNWEEKTPDQFRRDVSFVVENLTIRGDSGPYEVRAYFLGGNGQWVIKRITTTKMFVGSDKKYKQVLPKVIFDESLSDWRIDFGENKLDVAAVEQNKVSLEKIKKD